ncbi:MAG TPA: hypothetical protein VH257_03050, partial [Chloroflexota bacterium]|nr:hypothetical protein [Chloroflexota bacterium]
MDVLFRQPLVAPAPPGRLRRDRWRLAGVGGAAVLLVAGITLARSDAGQGLLRLGAQPAPPATV